MSSNRSNNIKWIVAMMIASQLLLMAFTGNWLYAQYQKEKDQLGKDIRTVLVQTNQEVQDSALMHKLIYPIIYQIKTAEITKDTFTGGLHQVSGVNGNASYKIMLHDSSILTANISDEKMPAGIKMSVENDISRSGIKLHRINTDKIKGTVYSVNDSVPEAIRNLLPSVIKKVIAGAMDSSLSDSLFWMDTAALRSNFALKAKANKWNFKTVWSYSDTTKMGRSKGIQISINNMTHANNVMIEGYGWHIFKKITPQIGFVCILLILTGASFWFAYRSLRQSMLLNTIKNDFISNMSHELKTPISTVKVALEALDNFNLINDVNTTRDYIKMAGLEMNRLDMLVNKTLNASLLEQGKIMLQKEQLDIQQLIEETITLMSLRFQQYNAQVQTIFKGNNFIVNGDKLHLQGVLINIIDNSLKYATKKPAITVTATAAEHGISIAIADNGPGIKEAYIKRIFDKFFRVPMGDTHNVKGYGLGLSYAKQIMTLHKGNIEVYNLSTEGCVFTINLPRS